MEDTSLKKHKSFKMTGDLERSLIYRPMGLIGEHYALLQRDLHMEIYKDLLSIRALLDKELEHVSG